MSIVAAPTTGRSTNGIRIKTLKDRQREIADNFSQTTGSRHASPDIAGATDPTKPLSTVTTVDNTNNIWETDGHNSA